MSSRMSARVSLRYIHEFSSATYEPGRSITLNVILFAIMRHILREHTRSVGAFLYDSRNSFPRISPPELPICGSSFFAQRRLLRHGIYTSYVVAPERDISHPLSRETLSNVSCARYDRAILTSSRIYRYVLRYAIVAFGLHQ